MRYSRPIIEVDQLYEPSLIRQRQTQRLPLLLACSDDVIGINWSPNFEAPLRVPEEHVEQFYKAYGDWVNIMRESNLELSFRLQPGTCVAFNNRRVLHARKSFDENAGTRHLQGTYVDLDEFSNRFRTLQRRFGAEDAQPTELSRIGNWSH
jgi:gamma-butyrobetaine dioxygenase